MSSWLSNRWGFQLPHFALATTRSEPPGPSVIKSPSLFYLGTSDDRTTVTRLSITIELISTNIFYSGLVATTTFTLYFHHVSLGSFNDQETQWLLQTGYWSLGHVPISLRSKLPCSLSHSVRLLFRSRISCQTGCWTSAKDRLSFASHNARSLPRLSPETLSEALGLSGRCPQTILLHSLQILLGIPRTAGFEDFRRCSSYEKGKLGRANQSLGEGWNHRRGFGQEEERPWRHDVSDREEQGRNAGIDWEGEGVGQDEGSGGRMAKRDEVNSAEGAYAAVGLLRKESNWDTAEAGTGRR